MSILSLFYETEFKKFNSGWYQALLIKQIVTNNLNMIDNMQILINTLNFLCNVNDKWWSFFFFEIPNLSLP